MSAPAPDAGTTLLERLRASSASLRRSEARVADVVLADPVRALDLTMAGLAAAAGVSEPTVMRFATAVGFDGFRSFKTALAQTVALGLPVTHSAITRDDSPAELTEKVFDHTISSLDLARRRIDAAQVARALDLLEAAREVLFVGFGASGVVAQDAQQKFPLFGVPCSAPADHHQQFIAAAMGTPSTVVVAISETGTTPEVLRVARTARRAGSPVVALTGRSGPLSALADAELRVATFEDTDHRTPSVSRLAALVVVDVLATGVALRRGEQQLERVRAMKEELARMRSPEPTEPTEPPEPPEPTEPTEPPDPSEETAPPAP